MWLVVSSVLCLLTEDQPRPAGSTQSHQLRQKPLHLKHWAEQCFHCQSHCLGFWSLNILTDLLVCASVSLVISKTAWLYVHIRARSLTGTFLWFYANLPQLVNLGPSRLFVACFSDKTNRNRIKHGNQRATNTKGPILVSLFPVTYLLLQWWMVME